MKVPELRFQKFSNESVWVEKNIKSVADLKNGYTFKSNDYSDSGKYYIITIANVQSGGMALGNPNRILSIPSDLQVHQKLNVGDILISMTGNVGRVCRVIYENCLLNQHVEKPVPSTINNEFFYQLLQNDKFQQSMKGKAAGGAQGNLSSSSIYLYTFQCPASNDEQQKIADCLSSLDDLITLQTQKLETLKTHKKGLMQGLFPAADEVTV
jgi:type I restriction enzyme, S subunit